MKIIIDVVYVLDCLLSLVNAKCNQKSNGTCGACVEIKGVSYSFSDQKLYSYIVNSRYSGHPRNQNLMSALVNVHNSRRFLQSFPCSFIDLGICIVSKIAGRPY